MILNDETEEDNEINICLTNNETFTNYSKSFEIKKCEMKQSFLEPVLLNKNCFGNKIIDECTDNENIQKHNTIKREITIDSKEIYGIPVKTINQTAYLDAILFVGLPLEYLGKLYNVAAVLHKGKVLAFIPKKNIPNYGEFYEVRHFTEGPDYPVDVPFMGEEIPMGCKILIQDENMQELVIGCEICEDIWAPVSPSTTLATAGATVIVNLSASDETVGKDSYRRMLIP